MHYPVALQRGLGAWSCWQPLRSPAEKASDLSACKKAARYLSPSSGLCWLRVTLRGNNNFFSPSVYPGSSKSWEGSPGTGDSRQLGDDVDYEDVNWGICKRGG